MVGSSPRAPCERAPFVWRAEGVRSAGLLQQITAHTEVRKAPAGMRFPAVP